MEWAVRRLDASLDEAELDPPPGAKAIIDVARGPFGTATVQGVTAAARVTVKVGTTALKALSVTMQVQLSVHQLHCHACSPDEALTRFLLPGTLLLVPVLSSFVKLWQGAYNDVYALADRRLLRQSENGLYSRASRQPWAF